jgi:hypothetical protein
MTETEIEKKWVRHSNDQLWEGIINSDPTLKFFLRDSSLDISEAKLMHQMTIKGCAFNIALKRYLDRLYP